MKALAKHLLYNKCPAFIKMMNLRAHTETLLLLHILGQKYFKNILTIMLSQKRAEACKSIILSSAQALAQIRLLASHAAHPWGRQLYGQ